MSGDIDAPRPIVVVRGGQQRRRHGPDRCQRPSMLHHELIDLVDRPPGIVGKLRVGGVAREMLLQLLMLLILQMLLLLLMGCCRGRGGTEKATTTSGCWVEYMTRRVE